MSCRTGGRRYLGRMHLSNPRVSSGRASARRRTSRIAGTLLAAATLLACGELTPPVPLEGLVLQDSVYLDAETLLPYTGRVVKSFPDDTRRVQLSGELMDGTWNGEIVVYHENGRIRYQGWLDNGEKCGAWIENRDSTPPVDVFAELKQEIESLGLYPPCPDGVG
jgi:hypothetical protein